VPRALPYGDADALVLDKGGEKGSAQVGRPSRVEGCQRLRPRP